METQLRPLSLSEILDRTAQLYRTHFLLFAGIAAVYAGALLVLGLAQVGLQELFAAWHWTRQLVWLNVGSVGVVWLAGFLLGGLAVAANNRAVAWVHLGEPATIRGAYAGVWPRLGTYLWLMAIISFVLWTPLALSYGGFAAVAFTKFRDVFHAAPGQAADPQQTLMFGALALGFFAVVTVAVVYAVLMGLRYALAVPACVVEKLKARAALRRSIDLSKGARGGIFVLGLLCVVIQVGLTGIGLSAFVALALKNHYVLPAWARVLQLIVTFATNTFLAPIYATGLTLFYFDQRVRKEGYDIVRMMEAAGLAAPSAAEAAVSVEETPAENPAQGGPA